MAWSVYQLSLAVLMVVTGSLNTLSTKWADKLESVNSEGELRPFQHPFLQACSMFVGEFSCMFAFIGVYVFKCWQRSRLQRRPRNGGGNTQRSVSAVVDGNIWDFNPLVLAAPALCDMVGTSTMYVGLTLTYASSFQMLRGAVIVFTGLLSVLLLGRRLGARAWAGIVLIIVGLLVVGVSDFLLPPEPGRESRSTSDVVTGDALIVFAQVIVALQMVLEERYVTSAGVPPLLAVGWEGLFGFSTLALLLFPMYYIHVGSRFSGSPQHRLEDALDAFVQLGNNWQLSLAFSGTVISIAFFNFAGVSVTKELSATTRMVLDSVRTLVIYTVSLALHWQRFHWLQPIGFTVLVLGMCVYNDVLVTPLLRRFGFFGTSVDSDEARLLANDDDDDGSSGSVEEEESARERLTAQ